MDRRRLSEYWETVPLIFQALAAQGCLSRFARLEPCRCGIFNAKTQSPAEGAEPDGFFAASAFLCGFALKFSSQSGALP